MKIDSLGDTLWTRAFAGVNGGKGYCVQLTSDGGYIVTGEFRRADSKEKEIVLIKTDSLGYVGVGEELDDEGISLEDTESVAASGSVKFNYSGCSNGYQADVYDVSGKKIDVIFNPASSGTITWPQSGKYSSGVFFIVSKTPKRSVRKVVLLQ